MPNLMKDNVVPVNTFPAIINWKFASISLLHHMELLTFYVIAVKNGW